MTNTRLDLDRVRRLAVAYRYARSGEPISRSVPSHFNARLDRANALSSLEISTHTSPYLSEIWKSVLARLSLPSDGIRLFVYSDPFVQALCQVTGRDSASVVISSGLVRLLAADELAFVLGHELAHFIYLDGVVHGGSGSSTLFIEQRAAEISADRIGLFACGELKIALRALMKTASGLGDRHLNLNPGEFLEQVRSVPATGDAGGQLTHPPIALRGRALARFASQVHIETFKERPDDGAIARVNALVAQELDAYLDGATRAELQALDDDIAMWTAARQMAGETDLDLSPDWLGFEDRFGSGLTSKMRNFFASHTRDELLTAIDAELRSTHDQRNWMLRSR